MTAAVEGVSKQCKELAKALDESFNMMVALTSSSTPTKNSAYPTPDASPSGRKDSPISFSLIHHQRLEDAEDIVSRPDTPKLATTPTKKHKVTTTTVSPYFARSVPRKIKTTESPYFTSPSKTNFKASDKLSCIPFPPLQATSFGLVQETLAHDPFRLLVAVIFLNKTRGHVALPVFYQLMESYPTPADLAAANVDDVVDIIQRLGLQNQRAATCINLAKAWLERPPEKGKRYRVLHYPRKGDGKDIQTGEVIDEDDKRVGWEIGPLPGVGAYAIDSWRIFCRDELRSLPTVLPKELTSEAKEADTEKEWARVLPLDKELRAYLRWRWLRNGWEWDPVTGKRKRADVDAMAKADKGGVMYEGDSTNSMIGQREINALGTVKLEFESEMVSGKESHVGKPQIL
ncbi:hypothetical protein JMJ35_000963 [Cladonia borealis]|uniref:HhH-GPD domain-containing protein n=1 Tax=Cladonia borealis TaxID=184061 RepID=A0AA39V9S1_9LECA|nr:hypothetical protein JMJ35_000963 [Cladonia borealis]